VGTEAVRQRAAARLPLPPAAILGAALVGSAVAGTALARSTQLGVAATVALCYVPLVLLDLRVGIVLWLPTVSLIAVPALDVGPNVAGIMILFAWLGAFATQRSSLPRLVSEQRHVLVPTGALVLWVLLSMAWAPHSAVGREIFFGWLVVGAIMLVASTTLTDRRYLEWAAAAFVVGVVFSVAIGVLGGAVKTSGDPSGYLSARVGGGTGDPNFLAAGIVPAIVLAFALGSGGRRPLVRVLVLATVVFLVLGLVATQSRGGIIAAAVAAIAALVLARRGRVWIVLALLWTVGAAVVWFSGDPVAWQRVSNFGEGSGRSELWHIGWRMWEDHPVFGVGLNGFRDAAGGYVLHVGPLQFVRDIVEEPKLVHNAYLELLTETGIIGFALYVGVIAVCLRCAWRAAHRFERLGDLRMATLARAVIVALLGILTASFFLSNATDRRTWVLLAMCPALEAASRRERASPHGARPAGVRRRPSLSAGRGRRSRGSAVVGARGRTRSG
jgi:O-antigen ligase